MSLSTCFQLQLINRTRICTRNVCQSSTPYQNFDPSCEFHQHSLLAKFFGSTKVVSKTINVQIPKIEMFNGRQLFLSSISTLYSRERQRERESEGIYIRNTHRHTRAQNKWNFIVFKLVSDMASDSVNIIVHFLLAAHRSQCVYGMHLLPLCLFNTCRALCSFCTFEWDV